MGVLLAKALVIATVIYAPCPVDPVAGGCAFREANTIYVNPTDGALLQDRNHELGHIVDYNLLTDQDRGTFLALIHEKRQWMDPGPNPPREQFAEAFRLCALSPRWLSRYTIKYDYRPTLYQHRKVCRWLTSLPTRP